MNFFKWNQFKSFFCGLHAWKLLQCCFVSIPECTVGWLREAVWWRLRIKRSCLNSVCFRFRPWNDRSVDWSGPGEEQSALRGVGSHGCVSLNTDKESMSTLIQLTLISSIAVIAPSASSILACWRKTSSLRESQILLLPLATSFFCMSMTSANA